MSVPDCMVVQEYTIFLSEGQHREQVLTESQKMQADDPPWAMRPCGSAALAVLPSLTWVSTVAQSQMQKPHGPAPAIVPVTEPRTLRYRQCFGRSHRALLERHWGQVRSALRLKNPVQW